MDPDPNLGLGYQVNRQRFGHPDSTEMRTPPEFGEMGGDPQAQRRPAHPSLVFLVWVLGLGGLLLSAALYFWSGLLVAFLVGLLASALIAAAVSGSMSLRSRRGRFRRT
jgi:hypothetical protein